MPKLVQVQFLGNKMGKMVNGGKERKSDESFSTKSAYGQGPGRLSPRAAYGQGPGGLSTRAAYDRDLGGSAPGLPMDRGLGSADVEPRS